MKTALAALLLASFVTLAGAQTQKMTGEKFYGKVTSIDAAAKTFSLHNKTRKTDATFAWSESTKFIASKQPIAASQLKAGDFLTVSYTEANGKKEAQRVVLRANSNKKKADQ